jgi:transcriptional regulator with XRE-family HTH domain
MNIGVRLRKLRLDMKKTLSEQSGAFNVSINTIYRWEHDITVPRMPLMKKIADYYGVSLQWILSGDGLKSINGALLPKDSAERQLLIMYRRLTEDDKYKILGYMECLYVEKADEEEPPLVIE